MELIPSKVKEKFFEDFHICDDGIVRKNNACECHSRVCENCGHKESHNLKGGYCSQFVLDRVWKGEKNGK